MTRMKMKEYTSTSAVGLAQTEIALPWPEYTNENGAHPLRHKISGNNSHEQSQLPPRQIQR